MKTTFVHANGDKQFTHEEILEIVNMAYIRSHAAADLMYKERGDHTACGFAWVEVKVRSNSKLGKALIAAGFDKSWKSGILQWWNPSRLGVQSVDILSEGALVAAHQLNHVLGLDFYPDSRLD